MVMCKSGYQICPLIIGIVRGNAAFMCSCTPKYPVHVELMRE